MWKEKVRKGLASIWQWGARLQDRLLYHGCDFGSWVEPQEAGFTLEQGNRYQPSNRALLRVLGDLPITSQDRILDIGCGKGHAMALMSRFPFQEVAGIELSAQLQDIANRNFARLGLPQCKVYRADAAVYQDYDRFTYIYLFNSVPRVVFLAAMEQLCLSLRRRPRRCVLIYLNPVYHEELVRSTPFRMVKVRSAWLPWFEYRVYTNGEN